MEGKYQARAYAYAIQSIVRRSSGATSISNAVTLRRRSSLPPASFGSFNNKFMTDIKPLLLGKRLVAWQSGKFHIPINTLVREIKMAVSLDRNPAQQQELQINSAPPKPKEKYNSMFL